MRTSLAAVEAVIFDYGNTLIEFGPRQLAACQAAIVTTLEGLYGPVDRERLRAIRDHQRHRVYEGEFRENDMRESSREIADAFARETATEEEVDAIVSARSEAFVDSIEAPAPLRAFLDRLGDLPLGLLSNYPSGADIRASVDRLGLTASFRSIVVSGEVGYAKPHPAPFERILDELAIPAERCLFVGDNWLGDIQGAKRMGMRAAWLQQYAPAEDFRPADGDHPADIEIEELSQLLAHLDVSR